MVARSTSKEKINHRRARNRKKAAVVTGASSDIGLGMARALLEHDYRVIGNSRRISKSEDLRASGDPVLVDGDIGKKETGSLIRQCMRMMIMRS